MRSFLKQQADEEHNFWMSYTDLMSGFLVAFIIISAVMYKSYQDKIRESNSKPNASLTNLINEYKDVFVMNDPDVKVDFDTARGSIILTHAVRDSFLFKSGDSIPQKSLEKYLDKIRKPLVKKTMEIWDEHDFHNLELRIEGHTDPKGIVLGTLRGSDDSFLQNLDLSSKRANAVYDYIFNTPSLSEKEKQFIKKNMISVGYSFARRVQQNNIADTLKDAESRRIEFRIISK